MLQGSAVLGTIRISPVECVCFAWLLFLSGGLLWWFFFMQWWMFLRKAGTADLHLAAGYARISQVGRDLVGRSRDTVVTGDGDCAVLSVEPCLLACPWSRVSRGHCC